MKTLKLTFESDDTRELFRRLAVAVPGVTVVDDTDAEAGTPPSGRYSSEADMDEALNIQWPRK